MFIDYDLDLRSAVGDVFLQRSQRNLSLDTLRLRLSTQVNVHHVPGQSLKKNTQACALVHIESNYSTESVSSGCFVHTHHVSLMVMLVFDDEDHVKSRQNSRHEVNVVLSFCIIPAAKYRVGSGQYRATGVQSGGDASLEVKHKR